MTRRSRFFLNSFLRFAAAAGFPGAAAASGAAFFCCSFATIHSISADAGSESLANLGPGPPWRAPLQANLLALLTKNLLLRRDRAAPRTLAGARVGVGTLAAHWQVPAVPDPAVSLNFDQPADVHLNLLAEIAFHAAFFFDFLAKMIDFIFRQVANLLRVIDIRLSRELLRAFLPDPIDRGQPDPKALLRRKINTCDTCHTILLKKSLSLALLVLGVDANYPHHAAPVDHLALVTNLFYRCPYFHAVALLGKPAKWRGKLAATTAARTSPPSQLLLITVHNPAAGQIVRRELHGDFVSRQNADEILAHLAGKVCQNLELVFQLDAEHRVRQRLDHRCHDFNGVLLGISGVTFLLFLANGSRHSLPCLFNPVFPVRTGTQKSRKPGCYNSYHDGPVISFGRVRIHGPLAVTATVCSKCAEGLPSAVSATHSSRMRTSGLPAFTIGSTAITMPSCSRAPCPASP